VTTTDTVPSTTTDRAGRLLSLAVRDLAVIDGLTLELGPGLNVLTGETGAGKSLVIDALGLVAGGRADAELVRHGADAARVEALFDRLPEPLIVVREVSAAGRSSARLDDEAVTAGRLAETIGRLVEIHGQHEQQHLTDERRQRDLLDAYGGHGDLRAGMAAAVERWRANRAALAELVVDPRELARRLEIAEHEAAEIAAARLRPGEAAGIEATLRATRHAEAIVRGAAAIRDSLGLEGGGTGEGLATALDGARALTRLDERWAAVAERLAGLEAELNDVAADVRAMAEAVEHDPRELARLEERLSVLYGLFRRYGDDEAAVIVWGERSAREAGRLRGLDEERARREAEDAVRLAGVARAAAALSIARSSVAGTLAEAADVALVSLGFPSGAFSVSIGRRAAGPGEPAIELDGDAVAFDAAGADEIVFGWAPNPGEPPRPLARIASGGELSRVALALEEVLARVDETPVLVFDEVDAGIGGRSADPVGRSLWALARGRQVVVITHLPQIAAYADAHFTIAKLEAGGRTVTRIDRLDRDGRIGELATMIGGPSGGPAARTSATELLDRAEAWSAEHAGLASVG
jgi:DNA repair protein RecN (Recombination protein N)